MRELVDKQLMLEDVKSWVAMDSYEQHLINNMSAWIENLPTVEVSEGDCISRWAALDAMKKITFPHWFECGEYLSEDTREIEIINSKKALEVIEALPSEQPEIIHCGDCKYYGRADKRRFYRGMDCLQKRIDTIVPDKDFCSRAERRTDE